MPQYQKAKPFDIVRTILDLQKAIKQLQVRSTGNVTPWTLATLSNSWTHVSNDGILYRLTENNSIQVIGRAVTPAGYTNGQVMTTIPYGTAQRTEYCGAVFYAASSSETACLLSFSSSGQLGVFGSLASTNTLIVNATFPLDGPGLP